MLCFSSDRLLLVERPESCLIFCNTRIAVNKVQNYLSRKGYASQALHGDIPQVKRLKIIQQFKRGELHLLVATDVAARGIHIDALSLVINYDVPIEKNSYVHRIGRTGRAGNGGRAITFVTGEDIMSLYEIEEYIGVLIAKLELPSEAVLNKHRAEAEKWKQAKFQKSKSLRAASESNLKGVRKKRSHTKHPQSEKYRDRQIQVNADHKAAERVCAVHPAEQAKSVHTIIAKPVLSDPTGTDVAHSKQSTEIVKSEASTTKKPFLQRVLQRILGK